MTGVLDKSDTHIPSASCLANLRSVHDVGTARNHGNLCAGSWLFPIALLDIAPRALVPCAAAVRLYAWRSAQHRSNLPGRYRLIVMMG